VGSFAKEELPKQSAAPRGGGGRAGTSRWGAPVQVGSFAEAAAGPKLLSGGDWRCPACSFNNFAKRTSCKQCNKSRSAAASSSNHFEKEHLQFQRKNLFRQDNSETNGDSFADEYRRSQEQNSFPKESRRFTDQRSELFNSGATGAEKYPFAQNDNAFVRRDAFQQQQRPGHGTAASSEGEAKKPTLEHSKIMEQEAEFDKMFENWERNFASWKLQNENNPDVVSSGTVKQTESR
jgi:hypothetical protein